MSMTRTALMVAAREIADATGSPRWSDATVRQWLGLVHWQEFKNILNANNEYTMANFQITEDANGQFLKSALDSGAADTLLTHYRIHAISQSTGGTGQNSGPNFFYKQVLYRDYPTPQANTAMPYVWYELGDSIQVLPVQQGTILSIEVNQLPQRADLLAADASTVVFPSGYEMLLAYMTARHMLVKGGAESPASMQMAQMAAEIRDPMMQDLRRASIWPTVARAMDEAAQWGGV